MSKVVLGKTGIVAEKNGFGCLPIQRTPFDESIALLEKACKAGIQFFDTARIYSDTEQKLGTVLGKRRKDVYVASKTMAKNTEDFRKDLAATLRDLKTDYLDLYQFHNPAFCPMPGDGAGLYETMLEAKESGAVRHIGITNHRLKVAHDSIDSGLYETLQFPFSFLSTEKELELVAKCKAAGMGFIAMKALSGGLITNSAAAYAYLNQFDNVLPIWGIQRESELDEFLSYVVNPPVMNAAIEETIQKDRAELLGEFCRGCGYCMPCPVGIEINTCARISLLLRRSPSERWLTEKSQAMMKKVEDCLHCNECKSKCPYNLDTPALLEKNYDDYKEILAGKRI
jgi:predicted aldo/keto reductase-like oxidoreductase